MASRQLRKLRKQQELLSLQNEVGHGSDVSEDEPIVAKPRGNMFSGFAALGDEGGGADDDEDDGQEGGADEAPLQPADHALASGLPAAPKKSRKKSSKKKKKKGKQSDSATPARDGHESVDEIDRVLEELKLESLRPTDHVAATAPPQQSSNGLNELLRINFQHLKAMNEMRRLFGKAMHAAELEELTQDNRQRTLPQNMNLETFLSARAVPPGRGPQRNNTMFDTVLRSNPFVDGKKTWPRGTAQGLKMIRVSEQEGPQEEAEFAFAHDSAYDSLEGAFYGLVHMHDPMRIVHFLHRYPYHVSSLIQVSKVARQDQNSALAADLIERALFTFGRASLSEFRKNLEKGRARMSFARPENRQFYLAGHNLIQKLVLKGTYRTALEWAKLFLSINHDDPYAMVNWIHVLAIRAREAQWFVDLCHSPLFDSGQITARTYARQTLSLAYYQLKDAEMAKATLVKGMETLPWLYCALFSALNLDTPPSVWGVQPRDEDERLHTELYIHTAKELWNTPQHVALLRDAAAAARRVADSPSAIAALPSGPPVSLATARFVYLDNTPSLMAAVPRLMLHASPNYDFDPLPPPRAENVLSTPTQALPWSVEQQQQRRLDVASARRHAQGLRAVVARLRADLLREQREAEERGQADPEGAERREQQLDMIDAELRRHQDALDVREAAGEGGPRGDHDEEGSDDDGNGGSPAQTRPEEEGQARPAPRERRFLQPPPRPPGLVNYLRYLLDPNSELRAEMEIVDQLDDWEAPTGMPGGWGQGEGWEEDEVDDWGQDEFEGVDDFEGGGGDEFDDHDGHEEGSERGRRDA